MSVSRKTGWFYIDGEETYDIFLATAEALFNAEYFGPAVVSAQTACEVITEEVVDFRFFELQTTGPGADQLRDRGDDDVVFPDLHRHK